MPTESSPASHGSGLPVNVRDLAPGTRVVLVHNTPEHAHDRVAPQGVAYIGATPAGAVIETRGVAEFVAWDDPDWYIADPYTLTAYTYRVEEPDLRGTPPELE